jgi:predicted RNase H-like nuclease (RuvC/YqgF family)
MRKFSTLIASGLVAATALTALPAQAQPYGHDRYDQRHDGHHDQYYGGGQAQAIRVQIDNLQQRVERVDRRDRISEREAAALRRDVYRLRQQYRDYSRNGLSRREVQVLQDRIQNVRQRLQYERRDNDGRRW